MISSDVNTGNYTVLVTEDNLKLMAITGKRKRLITEKTYKS